MTRRDMWIRTAHRRRRTLLALAVLPSCVAAYYLYTKMPHTMHFVLEWGLALLFFILFAWLSVGFWSAVAGGLLLLRGKDRFSPLAAEDRSVEEASSCSSTSSKCICPTGETDNYFRTALLFPVYNEDISGVMAGVRAVMHSLKKTGRSGQFDVFVLSDSTLPEIWVAEEEAWRHFCEKENAFGRVFYRHRRKNTRRKSGNVADFCRRWGAKYRYMVVFDADSLLSGECINSMVRAMEGNPDMGILQTMPGLVNSSSFIARMQQFSNSLYGPLFGAGLHFWQLGDAQYWGHNAIIRVEAFMEHCQLPILPGKPPMGGVIFSHDIVEAALMCRAGHEVWLTHDLKGSYEECPPSLLDELIRARRWCQGNLQHSCLVFAKGFPSIIRMLFVNGIMFYASALLWLGYLLFSSAQAVTEHFILPAYFSDSRMLFPQLPEMYADWAIPLFLCTLLLLFLPKFISVMCVIAGGRSKSFGGVWVLCVSALSEVIFSTLLAPIRMLSHSTFVLCTLAGRGIGWNPQNRGSKGTAWSDALRFHWWHTLLGAVWGWFMWQMNAGFFWWLSPIIAGLVLAVPLSVWTSRKSRSFLFTSPLEKDPPIELIEARIAHHVRESCSRLDIPVRDGFVRAVVLPHVYLLHLSLLRHIRKDTPYRVAVRGQLLEKALRCGPKALNRAEQMTILNDAATLRELHRRVWNLENGREAAAWGLCRG